MQGVYLRHFNLDPEFPFKAFETEIRGEKEKLHYQDYLQVGLCLMGEGKFLFTDKVYHVTEGDIFIVDNFELHEAAAEPPAFTRYLFLVFYPDLIAPPGARFFDIEYLSPFWYNSPDFCNKIPRYAEIAASLTELMLECRRIWNTREQGYRHFIDANLRKILALLMKHYRTGESEKSRARISNYMKIQQSLKFITGHFSENISLENVSKLANMSPSRFRHLFKEVTRIGFKEYIISRRLNEAKRLLITTNSKVTDIMTDAGFSNIYHFYQVFEKQMGMTPAEFRKRFRSNSRF